MIDYRELVEKEVKNNAGMAAHLLHGLPIAADISGVESGFESIAVMLPRTGQAYIKVINGSDGHLANLKWEHVITQSRKDILNRMLTQMARKQIII